MDVEVAHFVDAGEKDGDGQYDYYYEGDNYTFRDVDGQTLVVRTYIDASEAAHFIATHAQVGESELASAAADYLALAGRTVFLCLGPSGGYETWTPHVR